MVKLTAKPASGEHRVVLQNTIDVMVQSISRNGNLNIATQIIIRFSQETVQWPIFCWIKIIV